MSEIRVCAGIFLQLDKVLLSRRSKNEIAPLQWQFPGGKARIGESNFVALARELHEELGVEVRDAHLFGVERHEFDVDSLSTIYFYVIDDFSGSITALENQELCWSSLTDVGNLKVITPNRNVLQRLKKEVIASKERLIWDDVWNAKSTDFSHPNTRAIRASSKIEKLRKLGLETNVGDIIGDIGCGTGEISFAISRSKVRPTELFAIDSSTAALRVLKSKLEAASGITILQNDVSKLPLPDNFFTKIIALGILEHLCQPKLFLEEMSRILKPGGEIFFGQSNCYSIFYADRVIRQLLRLWPYGYQKNWTPRRLRKIVEPYFSIENIEIALPGDDSPIYRYIDRVLNKLWPNWGRTIYLKARKS